MFFFFNGYLYFMIAAAIIPALFLIRYIYKMDRLEREPVDLIIALIVAGIVSAFLAMALEQIGDFAMGIFGVSPETYFGAFIQFFVIVGPAEEFAKYTMMYRNTWKNKEFNCQFDAVVYAVTVSLGFALIENIIYVFRYGLSVALLRAVTAVPGHACFGVFMGVWYGVAKKKELDGDYASSSFFRKLSVILPALIHGLYDFIATVSGGWSGQLVFIVFVGAMFYASFKITKKLSDLDRYM